MDGKLGMLTGYEWIKNTKFSNSYAAYNRYGKITLLLIMFLDLIGRKTRCHLNLTSFKGQMNQNLDIFSSAILKRQIFIENI